MPASTIIIALIIVTFVMAICILLISIHKKHTKKLAKQLISKFRCEAKKNDLSISKWEMAGKSVIGLEAGKKIIYAFQKHLGQYRSYLVDLSKVKNCLKKKVYSTKLNGKGKNERYEREVEHISLQFEFIDERPPVMISFYNPVNNHLVEMAEMEQKAADWEDLVRGIIHPNYLSN